MAEEVPGTCPAFNTSSTEAGPNNINVAGGRMVNPKAVLSSMFAEYRTEQRRRREVELKLLAARGDKPSAAAPESGAAADFEQELMRALSETLKLAAGASTKPAVPVPQPQLTVETVITVSLWDTPFTVYAATGIQRYQGNLILSVAPPEVNATESDAEEEEEDDYGQDTFDYSEWGGEDDEGLEVVAVQALFGPFFSAFIGRSFELIYLPHDLCPGQGFHMDPDDSFARVVLVPRGGCNFVDKANELRRFRVAGMLVYNTDPDEQALEMTAADMDVPVPSAMVSYADGMALKQALARRDSGVLVMRARADQTSEPSASSTAPDAAVAVVDVDALRVLLQNHFEQQHNCQGEDCIRFLNPGLPIVIDSQVVPKRPAEEADRVPPV